MGAPGLTSPIRSDGFLNLQLNAGVFLKNFPIENYYAAEALKKAVASAITAGTNILGMTSGGGTFNLTREMRLPEADGRRYNHKGAHFVDSMDGYFTGTLVETTYGNLEAMLGKNVAESGDPDTMLRIHTAIDIDDDYLTNIVWVGDLSDGRFVAIVIENALNTADFSWTFQDKNEGKLPFEFHSHQANVNLYDTAPVRIEVYDNCLAYRDGFRAIVSASQGFATSFVNLTEAETLEAGKDYLVIFNTNNLSDELAHGVSLELQVVYDGYENGEISITSEHCVGGNAFIVPVTPDYDCAALRFYISGFYGSGMSMRNGTTKLEYVAICEAPEEE